jgi:amidase
LSEKVHGRPRRHRRSRLLVVALAAIGALLMLTSSASALNYVVDSNGDSWGVEDAAAPGLDTGSIHNTGAGSLEGFGGIRVQVTGAQSTPMLNGALMRGFGLTYDGVSSFTSHQAVSLGPVAITRKIDINKTNNYARWYDTFTNTGGQTITVDVAFGGQLGYNTGTQQSAVFATSSGDVAPTPADAWVVVDTPSTAAGNPTVNGPSAVVLGTPQGTGANAFSGAITGATDFLEGTFTKALPTTGAEANEYGYVNHLTIAPGQTKALVHYVVIGLSETKKTPSGGAIPATGSQTTAVENEASTLATTPDLSGLSTGDLCAITNWNAATITAAVPGYSVAQCTSSVQINAPAPLAPAQSDVTTSPYNVVGKSITQELADMASGATSSQDIVRAYLDRIAAYDQGPLGWHAFIEVNPQAMADAKAADAARAAGSTLPLLGVPIAVKDIYDTEDQPTTGGSLVFQNFQPTHDAWLVHELRAAGAIILGKTGLAEFATDGYNSPDAYGQVWNAFDPSKSPTGSSGGSAVCVALSMCAAALGTQTGDSLWGPSSAASLVSLRGTDGLTSTEGVMPLTYIQDYAGIIARTVPDQALLLNTIATRNPTDATQELEGSGWDSQRPTDWTSYLKTDALQGKVIGYYASQFVDPFGDPGTSNAMQAEFKYFTAAGATMKLIPDPPAAPSGRPSGDFLYEGWLKWIEDNPNSPYQDPGAITNNQLRLSLFRTASATYTGTGATSDATNAAFVAYRQAYQASLAQWMSNNGVDAVVYPGELSNINLNDSIDPSFGRLDPQASNAGVPTAIFPAGLNPDGQPDDLQLEGPDYSDPELMGMAYAFEAQANAAGNGYEQTKYAPALAYDPDATPATTTTSAPAPPPVTSAPGTTTVTAVTTVTTPAASTPVPGSTSVPASPAVRKVSLVRTRLTKGAIALTYKCTATTGNCEFLERVVLKLGFTFPLREVVIKHGSTKTITITPTPKPRAKLATYKSAGMTITLSPISGSAVAKARTQVTVRR